MGCCLNALRTMKNTFTLAAFNSKRGPRRNTPATSRVMTDDATGSDQIVWSIVYCVWAIPRSIESA